MDKSWMTIRNRLASTEYEEGVKSFLQFAMGNLGPQPEIRCPCNECLNGKKHSFEVVKIHLIRRGIDSSYKTWVHHGEYVPAPKAHDDDHHDPNEGIGNETGGEVPKDGNQMQNMVEDVFVGGLLDDDSDELPANIGRGDVQSFDKLFNAAQRKIYPGGEKTVLAFIVEMLHVKVYKKMPNDTFNIMMNVIKGMRQDYDESIPWNTYEAKKFLRDLGLGYVPIHACINDCALFWKENGNMENCPKCNEPRYKVNDDCIMPPGSKKSSASFNSTSTMHNTAAVQVGTGATTPVLEILTSTSLTIASPSTRASASGAPSAKRRHVRGPTRGKRIQRIIAENKGERISVYVTPEMRAFCGINANKVASELGTQIRWQCPIQGFYSSWNDVADQLQRAVIQAVRDKFKVTENGVEGTELVEEIFHEKANLIYKDWKWRMNDFYTKTLDAGLDAYQHPFQEMPMDDWKYMIDHVFNDPKREPRKKAGKLNREAVPYGHTTGSRSFAAVMTIAADREEQRIANEGNDDAGNGNEPNSNENNEGNANEGRKKLDICDLFEASYRLRDTNEWINSTCKDKHEMMVATRDEAALSGTPLSTEELSIKCLGESTTKNYIRGLGTGPKPCTYLSKSNSQSASQDQLQKLQRELDLIREEQRQREEEQRQREEKYEEKRRWEETQRQQAEEWSILLKEMEVFKSFMSQMQNGGRGNMGAG